MALVLSTGNNPLLVEARKIILQQAGHNVITAMDELEAAAYCQIHRFEVAVIGHSASRSRKHALASVIRKYCPSAKILELYIPYEGKVLSDADSWLEAPSDIPPDLLERVNELAAAQQDAANA